MVRGMEGLMRGACYAEMPLARRNAALDGIKDELKGMRQIGGEDAVAQMRALIDRYAMLLQK